MSPFLFMPLWCLFWLVAAGKFPSNLFEQKLSSGGIQRPHWSFAVLMFLPIFLLAAFGRPISDTWAYIAEYSRLNYSRKDLWEYLISKDKEYGFAAFCYIAHFLSGGSVFFFRGLIGLIHVVPVIAIYRRYSCNYVLSVFLFVCSGTYVGWMMNGLRQFMAVTIIFSATPLLVKKRFFAMIVIILIASCFHKTALIMLPIIFIVHGEAFNKRTILYIIGTLVMTRLFSGNDAMLEDTMAIGGYGDSLATLRSLGDRGTSTLRVIVSFVPVVLAWLGQQKIRETEDVFLNMCVNMSVITAGIYLISAVTSGIMIGRLPIYTGLYGQILLPWLVTRLYDKNTSSLIMSLMILAYLCYYPFEAGARLWR